MADSTVRPVIIGIQKTDKFSMRQVQPRIAGGCRALIRLSCTDDVVTACNSHFDACICGTIIHDNDFQFGAFLAQDALQSGAQRVSSVEYRNNHAEQGGMAWFRLQCGVVIPCCDACGPDAS